MSQADNAAAISWAATLDTNWVCEVYASTVIRVRFKIPDLRLTQ